MKLNDNNNSGTVSGKKCPALCRIFTKEHIFIFAFMIVIVIAISMWNRANPIDYSMYETDTLSHPKGTVVKIVEEELARNDTERGRKLGYQVLEVQITSGEYKGETITVKNDVTNTHHIICEVGSRIIVKADTPEGTEPYYSVYNYDHTKAMLLLFGVFAVLMVIIGKKKGFLSLCGLVFAMIVLLRFLLPAIFHGWQPIVATVIAVSIITFSSLMLLNGWNKKTRIAIIASISGVVMAAIVYFIFAALLHLNGYNLESSEELILIRENTGMGVADLLFVSIIISALGAILDMAMSVVSSIFEIRKNAPELSPTNLLKSGLSVGRDMIGTNCQTLILAFIGSSITTLLVVISYGYQTNQLLNSDFIAIEMLQGMTGSIAVILSVPVASMLSAWVLGVHSGKVNSGENDEKMIE
ncbi:MAG: YibE/F family protein [Eubacterium sp.]|nr:YibE/F family protein [Eubacterium sp.]